MRVARDLTARELRYIYAQCGYGYILVGASTGGDQSYLPSASSCYPSLMVLTSPVWDGKVVFGAKVSII